MVDRNLNDFCVLYFLSVFSSASVLVCLDSPWVPFFFLVEMLLLSFFQITPTSWSIVVLYGWLFVLLYLLHFHFREVDFLGYALTVLVISFSFWLFGFFFLWVLFPVLSCFFLYFLLFLIFCSSLWMMGFFLFLFNFLPLFSFLVFHLN